MLFSATYDKDVMDFAENIVPNPVVSTEADQPDPATPYRLV
jgi:superfamily II DNA/RNA helicase